MSEAPFILGLDLATKTGVCHGRVGERPTFHTKDFGDCDLVMLAGRAVRWSAELLQTMRPDAVFIEAPMSPHLSKNGAATEVALTLFGAVCGVMEAKYRNAQTARVQTVRKSFLSVGRPDNPKDCVMRLCRSLGWDPKNTDEADAGALWWHGGLLVAPRLTQIITPMQQQRALNPGSAPARGGLL